jgi:uncharacterized damage-inducible protein DinB
MYRQIEDFLTEWKYESSSTIKLFKNINNSVLNKKGNKNVRSIAVLSWHIAITIKEMMGKAGLNLEGPVEHSQAPDNISDFISAYEKSSDSLIKCIQEKWNDESLHEETNMYGKNWKKGITLSVLVKHQAHHRGQLTVLMRQAGLKVSGVYGPSKEEWAEWNMPPME